MTELYPYLILAGVSIMAASVWLLRQARQRSGITNELVELNRQLHFDLPDFLRQCWEPLSRAGFKGLQWRLEWFGSVLSHIEGQADALERREVIERQLEVEDIRLSVSLIDSRRRFEQRFFSNMVAESFLLLLYTDMWVKLGTIRGASAQAPGLPLPLQQDTQELARLLAMTADQLQAASPGQERQLLESLRSVVPLLKAHSNKLLDGLGPGGDEAGPVPVELARAFRETAGRHSLEVSINGQGSALLRETVLYSICDRLLAYFSRQARRNPELRPMLSISIGTAGDSLEVAVTDVNGPGCHRPERLFEPSWSQDGEANGVSLYLARQLLLEAGGDINVLTPADGPMTFVISLPAAG